LRYRVPHNVKNPVELDKDTASTQNAASHRTQNSISTAVTTQLTHCPVPTEYAEWCRLGLWAILSTNRPIPPLTIWTAFISILSSKRTKNQIPQSVQNLVCWLDDSVLRFPASYRKGITDHFPRGSVAGAWS